MTQRDFVSTAMTTTSGSGQLQIDLDVAHARVALTGELDLATVPVLREAAAVLLSETAEEITIDLGGLQFIDAAGLGDGVGQELLLEIFDRLAEGDRSLRRGHGAGLAQGAGQAGHLVAPGGKLVAMKGVYPYDEIARVPSSHRVAQVLELHVPSLEAKRHLVVLEAA